MGLGRRGAGGVRATMRPAYRSAPASRVTRPRTENRAYCYVSKDLHDLYAILVFFELFYYYRRSKSTLCALITLKTTFNVKIRILFETKETHFFIGHPQHKIIIVGRYRIKLTHRYTNESIYKLYISYLILQIFHKQTNLTELVIR